MIDRTTIFIVVITVLLAGAKAFSQGGMYSVPDARQSVPAVTKPVVVNSSPASPADVNRTPTTSNSDFFVNIIQYESYLRKWRIRLEGLVIDNSDPYYLISESNDEINRRRRLMNSLEEFGSHLKDDNYRSSLYGLRASNDNRRIVTTASLLRLYHEAVLLQSALYAVHCKWRQENNKQLNAFKLVPEYQQFLINSGIDLNQKKYTVSFSDNSGIVHTGFRGNFVHIMGDDITARRNLYDDVCQILMKDVDGLEINSNNKSDEQNNYQQLKSQFDRLYQEKEAVKTENERLKNEIVQLRTLVPKLPSREEFYSEIRQIQKKGEGTLEIVIAGQPFRFVYVSPGTYYMGIEDGEQAAYMRQLSQNNMISVGVHTIKLQSGFFIMEDKITPKQLQAVYNVNSPNGLKWIQANESAQKTTQLFCKQFNANVAVIRLPTEIEWECAMRGKESKKLFPWGNDDPQRNPGADVTELKIRNAGSLYSEWCLDRYESYYFPVKTDLSKEILYEPHGSTPNFTYFIRERQSIAQVKNIVEDASEPSIRSYRGASSEDYSKGLFANRAISMRRSNRSDQVNPNISFRYVLIPPKNL